MMIPVGLAAVSQPPEPVGQRAIVRDNGSAVAQRAEILGRVEAERSSDADGADRPSARGCEVRLAAVLDDRQVVPCGDALDRRHVGRLPVQVNRQQCPRARRHRAGNLPGIDRHAGRVDIGKHRPRAGHHDGQRAVSGRQGSGDHLVAGAGAERAQHEGDRIGASPDADGAGRARRGREFLFERLDLGPEHEPSTGNDAVDRASHVRRILARHER